jgi:hypothetical protein
MTRKLTLASATVLLALFGISGTAFAQSDAQCDAFQAIVKSPPPSEGALAALEHTVAVLKSAIAIIDLPCGAPYIVSTDREAISQERERLYMAWRQARQNCLQITSGEPDDRSPCKEEVSSGD